MNKKHIITIAGKLGSGKSSTAKRVAEILGYKHYSTGDFMRSMAAERGLTLAELCEIAESNPSVDQELDNRNLSIGEMDNIVLDSRLAFHFIPTSFKVFLELDPIIGAERILKDKESNPNRNKETNEGFETREQIVEKINQRLDSERKRYKELYNIDNHTASQNFDLVINTEKASIEEVTKKIIDEYNNWLNK